VIDRWGRLSDPAYFAAGNLLRGVETAGWCWSEGRRVARSILAALEGRLPQPGGARVTLAHPALRLAVPQVIAAQGEGAAHSRLQIRLDRPAKGRLQLRKAGASSPRPGSTACRNAACRCRCRQTRGRGR
jgi:hypothetical protein